MKEKIVYPPILGNVDGSFQSDLMFMTNYKTKNSGFHIIFNFIEITSRKAYSYKMKTKKAGEIIENFKQFFCLFGLHLVRIGLSTGDLDKIKNDVKATVLCFVIRHEHQVTLKRSINITKNGGRLFSLSCLL